VRLRAANGSVAAIGSFPVDTASEKGLLNVLVHPSFAQNRRLLFYYSLAADAGGTNQDRHRVSSVVLATNNTLDMASEQILVRGLLGPANHDGGAMAIGPDGKLYVGVGDSGCNSGLPPVPVYTPTNYNGTCLSSGNGKILRVNLDGTIPSDNPLVGVAQATACGTNCRTDPATVTPRAPRPDVWAWGFRNPWRSWFDPATGNCG
jgi:glucose/arabinose dehydrogenase